MTVIDQSLAADIAALQASGASRAIIAARFAELGHTVPTGMWAASEAGVGAVVQTMWADLGPRVDAAIEDGSIARVECLNLRRCEDGVSYVLMAETGDDDTDIALRLYTGGECHRAFIEAEWIAALEPIAEAYGADAYCFDCHVPHVMDTVSPGPWRRL